jgi:hypothetical protein
MAIYVTEILDEINKDPKTIEKWKNDGALKFIVKHAFEKEHKFILPEGDPPYRESNEPIGMTPTNFKQELRRLYVFCRSDLKPIKREALFIGLLETIHPSEAKLLLAVKDQKLSKMYPKITAKLVAEAGLITLPVKEKKNA